MENYLEINKAAWNAKVPSHLNSEFYDMENFKHGNTSLKEIELALLSDIHNKNIIHFQCHFGQDTISLERLGAKVIGIDFSEDAIRAAKALAILLKSNTEFVCTDIYQIPNLIQQKFDIVFTSYGTVGWLPDINKWAASVVHCLDKGGKLIMVDFHPVLWMYSDDFSHVQYKYSNAEPIIEVWEGSYADKTSTQKSKSISWNHGLGEIIQALINVGMQIEILAEHHCSPYNIFPEMKEISPNRFCIEKFGDKIPYVYSIVAIKK
jgi:SAM-dependent methyltransferase